MEHNGRVCPVYSMNLSRAQAVVSVLAGMAVFLTAVFTGMAWARSSIVEAASQDFQDAMDTYYARIVPERNQYYQRLLDGELLKFELETSKPIEVRLDKLDGRVTVLETQGGNVVKTLDRHEKYLLELLRRVPEEK